jgi:hypothetical protein
MESSRTGAASTAETVSRWRRGSGVGEGVEEREGAEEESGEKSE